MGLVLMNPCRGLGNKLMVKMACADFKLIKFKEFLKINSYALNKSSDFLV
jgi:hypothetical protein